MSSGSRELERRVRVVEQEAHSIGPAARAYATSEPPDPEDELRERLWIPCADHVPRKWGNVRRLLRRTTGEWLPWAECAEYVAAEMMSALPLEVDPAVERSPNEPALALEQACARSLPAARACSQPDSKDGVCCAPALRPRPPHSRFIEALREGLAEADACELDRRLRRAVALERGLLCKMGPLLVELADARAYRELGLRGLDAYARERLGMAPRKARALLRVERACQRSASLRNAWHEGRISWSQAQTLVAVVTHPGAERLHDAWIARAAAVSVRRLEDDVDDALERDDLDPARLPALPELGVSSTSVTAAEDPGGLQTRARPTHWRERTRVVVWAAPEVVRLFRACLATVQLELERVRGRPASAGEALEAMCDHVIEVWSEPERRLPGWERRSRAVYERDGWRCTVPGCRSYRNLHAHHIQFRSRGGSDEAHNLTTVCAAHHARGVHAGQLRIRGLAPFDLHYEMPLGSWRSGDLRVSRSVLPATPGPRGPLSEYHA